MAQRIIRQRGQANNGVVAGHLGAFHVAYVAGESTDPFGAAGEITAFVEPRVEPVDLVAGSTQERQEHRSYVTAVTGDQNPHVAVSVAFRSHTRSPAGIRPAMFS